MKKLSDFLVEKRKIIILVVLAFTVLCGFLIFKVNVNKDMTKYLPEKSSMKKGMDIMNDSFPEAETDNTIRVMYKDLPDDRKQELAKELSEIEYVSDVDFKAGDEDYEKDGYTKYVLHMEYDYGSKQEKSIVKTLKKNFSDYDMCYMNDSGDGPGMTVRVMVLAVLILMTVLIIMSGSWFEPLLFLFTIAVAVVINLGTNIIMGTISDKTFSCTAILQLVLSMDYSIILINRYRQELKNISDKKEAMKAALVGSFSSIAGSSLTTIVGLLVLVFMSFKIGFDMGVVLAKGVFCSVVCVFLILPGLILTFSKVIEKTAKPVPDVPTGGLSRLCGKIAPVLCVVFVFLFAGAYYMQTRTVIGFSMLSPDKIADVFPNKSMVVMIYENTDDEAVTEIAEELEERDDVDSAANYSNTLAKQHTSKEMVDAIDELSEGMGNGKKQDYEVDASLFNMLYFKYYGDETGKMTVGEFLSFLKKDVLENPNFASRIGDDMNAYKDMLARFSDAKALKKPQDAKELAEFFGMDENQASQLIMYYYSVNEDAGEQNLTLTLAEFIDFILKDIATDPAYAPMFDEDAYAQMDSMTEVIANNPLGNDPLDADGIVGLTGMKPEDVRMIMQLYAAKYGEALPQKLSVYDFLAFLNDVVLADPAMSGEMSEEEITGLKSAYGLVNLVVSEKEYSENEMLSVMSSLGDGLDENIMELLYIYHDANKNADKKRTMSIEQLMHYLADSLIYDKAFSSMLDEEMINDIKDFDVLLADGIKQLKGDKYSRLIMTVTVPEEGEEAEAFYRELNEKCEVLSGEYHLIGSSAMNYEMSLTFRKELLTITILTALAIFIVVLISFRSLVVPVILVLLVQCGVFITVSVIGIQGYSIHYLALLIVQCILMGSTIDYGILFSNYYREARESLGRTEALKTAYSGSMHTILTSGLIMVVVTAIMSKCFGDPTVEQICRTISIGATSAILLIIFILPGVLYCLDRFTAGKKKTES
ncbi:MAG: MMPL family transporter [Lachnospiraceae bacterium]|nr:MMPL family transporter [Lachnospiraceae bacterium]